MIKKSAYSINHVSKDAVVALVMSGLSVCLMILSIIISYFYNGKGPSVVGFLGIVAIVLSFLGIVFTVNAWKSEDGGLLMKKIAGILNAIPLIIELFFYITGWF